MKTQIIAGLGAFLMCTGIAFAETEVGSGEATAQQSDAPPVAFPDGAEGVFIDLSGPVLSAMPDERFGEYGDAEGPGRLMIYDVLTGELTSREAPGLVPPSPRVGERGGTYDGMLPTGDGPFESDVIYRTFVDMTAVTAEEVAPWRRNVRIRMWFTDTNGTQRVFRGSGTMVDAQTVITAGHCVYMRTDSNGNVYNTWADQIVVSPAWDDSDGDGVGEDDNWGSSTCLPTSTSMAWWTGWSDDGDFDWDIAIFSVDRPVGMLTGWHAVSSGGSCSSIIDNYSFHNASYPAQNCPLAGLHTGNQMYYWFGTFDDCVEDNQFRLTTGGGNCFDTVWGGMSGSSAYYIDEDDNRRVLGICSNSNRIDRGGYVHVWGNVQDELYDTMIPNARGTNFDPHALYTRSTASLIDAGQSIPDLKMSISNPTNASSTADWSFVVYLSTDDVITSSDLVISNQTANAVTIDAMSNMTINMAAVTIPISTVFGTHFVGVQATASSDTDWTNNVTQTWDTLELWVSALPDHQFTSFAVTPADVVLDGGQLQADWTMVNNGGAMAGPILFFDYYASTNETISIFDTFVGTFQHVGVDGLGGTGAGSDLLTLPAGLAGTSSDEIWIGALVESHDIVAIGVIASPVTVYVLPPADDCADAVAISNGDHFFDTTFATTDGSSHESCEYDGQTYNDIWFTYQATCTGELTLSTCSQADYDTDLVLYGDDGSGCAGLLLLACDDDTAGCDGYTSLITVPVVAGEAFYIRVGGWNEDEAGTGTLSVSCDLVLPSNDNCTDAEWITSGDHFIDTQLATTDGPDHGGCEVAGDGGETVNDIWYLWTADCEGTVTISTCDTVNYDSDLVLYRWNGDCGSSTFVACNDDGPGCGDYSSFLQAEVESGQDYLIRVGGWSGTAAGYGWMSVDCEPAAYDADLDGDGDVDVDDLLMLLASFNAGDGGDINGDGLTNVDDLLILLSLWGT